MTLTEVMASATVLAVASGCSLQLWAGALAASEAVEQQRQQLARLDGQLLRSAARLRAAAEQRLADPLAAPFATCDGAASWMAAQLEAMDLVAPSTLELQVEPSPQGMVRLLLRSREGVGTPAPMERQRRLSPVAYGLCSALEEHSP